MGILVDALLTLQVLDMRDRSALIVSFSFPKGLSCLFFSFTITTGKKIKPDRFFCQFCYTEEKEIRR